MLDELWKLLNIAEDEILIYTECMQNPLNLLDASCVYWKCTKSCVCFLYNTVCLYRSNIYIYIYIYIYIFFSSSLKVIFCCVISASDAFLLLVYLSGNTSLSVHDWEELLHTLEKKNHTKLL
jgi:hypothetical protein